MQLDITGTQFNYARFQKRFCQPVGYPTIWRPSRIISKKRENVVCNWQAFGPASNWIDDHRKSWVRPMPRQCMANVKTGYKKPETKQTPISLKNLKVLISFLAFLVEQIISIMNDES
ncbi:uncharacterized protein LOC124197032 [Daphnia pulex]|uniref:uncharacterized protein LOC124197032 n=1 Tax=Daphnia pulex TaxID=6669 RepID=UPI001EDF1781|nr:uncharacterized protein LOC124197032 [Daphnia pulex]